MSLSRHLNHNLFRLASRMRFRHGLFNHHQVGALDIDFNFHADSIKEMRHFAKVTKSAQA